MTTHRTEYRFTVKEFESGTPWLMLEPMRGPDLPLPKNAFLGLDLKEGTTLEEAQEIARYLNRQVRSVSMTV